MSFQSFCFLLHWPRRPYLIRGLLPVFVHCHLSYGAIFIIKQYENRMLGIGTPLLLRDHETDRPVGVGRRYGNGPRSSRALSAEQTSLSSPRDGLSQRNNSNDAICLNLKMSIYKHFMAVLPGERRGSPGLMDGFLLLLGMGSEVDTPFREWFLTYSSVQCLQHRRSHGSQHGSRMEMRGQSP